MTILSVGQQLWCRWSQLQDGHTPPHGRSSLLHILFYVCCTILSDIGDISVSSTAVFYDLPLEPLKYQVHLILGTHLLQNENVVQNCLPKFQCQTPTPCYQNELTVRRYTKDLHSTLLSIL